MKSDSIAWAFKKALKRLDGAKDYLNLLPSTVANFLLVHSAQGAIDNGGFRYFFESDWPSNPPYMRFVEAYRAIGCEKQAIALARVVSTFPFETPHLNKDKRNKFIDDNYDEVKHEITGWGDELCGDNEVWNKLRVYYETNLKDFA